MSQEQPASPLDRILCAAPVIPVLVIERLEDAVPIAEALVAGGLPAIEVTLRTPAALDAIRAMKSVAGAIVGAGTVLDIGQFRDALRAGAEFIVSPGLTRNLAMPVVADGVPFLPGVSSAADIMLARDMGLTRLKFFPAEAAGGLPLLKALSAVFRDMRFCPTGGITQENAQAWLDLPSVACVGGSWLVPAGEPVDPAAIRRRAQAAATLRRA